MKTKPRPSKSRTGTQRYLRSDFVNAHLAEIGRVVGPLLRQWRAHGWRIAGVSPRLRLEVLVPQTFQHPGAAVDVVEVAGFRIKPSVVSSHSHHRRGVASNGTSPTAIGLARAVAPGARIRAGRGPHQEFVGVAAILSIDGAPMLLTCGHAVAFQFSDEILPGDVPNGQAIGRLERNLLEDSAPIDAALCSLTTAGLELLDRSPAPTWRFQSIRTPAAEDNGREATFWETHDGQDEAPTSPVVSFSGSNSALFPPGGPRDGFIETEIDINFGDSGSLLSFDSSLYGICSGFVGSASFFTPISSVQARLVEEGHSCVVQPFPRQ